MITMKRYNIDCYQILNDEILVGFANRMGNGSWCAFDTSEHRLTPIGFAKPSKVKDWFASRS